MNIKINNLNENNATFKNTNFKSINLYKQKNKIIIFLLILIVFAFCLLSQIFKIKKLNKKIKNLDDLNSILKKEIEAIFSYTNNSKNASCIYQLIKPMDVIGKQKVRIGKKGDGGYILLNDFNNTRIAYSFGINNEISFEEDLATRDIEVYMYDHTINKIPKINPKFHWKKIGLTGKKVINKDMKTLKELIKENGHINEKNMILKMDIEESEWEVFLYMNFDILRKFEYILVEFHFENRYKSMYSKVFKKLNKTHQIFHLHCNNCGGMVNFDGHNICYSLEISFVIKGKNTFVKSSENYPVKNIDYRNCNSKPEINNFLNIYQLDNIFSLY